jgi:hypothetical protein
MGPALHEVVMGNCRLAEDTHVGWNICRGRVGWLVNSFREVNCLLSRVLSLQSLCLVSVFVSFEVSAGFLRGKDVSSSKVTGPSFTRATSIIA